MASPPSSGTSWQFASFEIEPLSPLHLGAGRRGFVATTHAFVPGHLFAYALASQIGQHQGGKPEHFAQALQLVLKNCRFGPALVKAEGRALLPTRDGHTLEAGCVTGQNHVSLDLESSSAVEGALFEVESLSPRWLCGARRGQPVRLGGGVWYRQERLAGLPLSDWLGRLRLGGELKTGQGHIHRAEWNPRARDYHGIGPADHRGLHLEKGQILPGAALDGMAEGALRPWLGRLHCPENGFGRRLGAPALVVLDGVTPEAGTFLPSDSEVSLGCWERV
jgi:hypothetical protein